MRRSSKLFGLAAAAAFLAALAWALAKQADLAQAERNRLRRPAPGPEEPVAAPPESATGVVGTVDEGTQRALARHLQAQAEARKRLEAPPPKGNRP